MLDDLKIADFSEKDNEKLIHFLINDIWEFHGNKKLTKEKIEKLIEEGFFLSNETKTFFIELNDNVVAMIRLFDLEDQIPMFDIRIKSYYRGKKIGEFAMEWMKKYIFLERKFYKFEGNTRVDNIAMRKLFKKSGFVKESHHRKSWPDNEGNYFDSIGYGILREDYLENKTTPVQWNDENFL